MEVRCPTRRLSARGWLDSKLNSQQRARPSPRGVSGWRTRATLTENLYRSMTEANKGLMRRLNAERDDVDDAKKEVRRLLREREEMLREIFKLRRDMDTACGAEGRVRALDEEVVNLRSKRDRFGSRFDESERENHSLLHPLMVLRRRQSS